ncbi:6-phosphogluconolactonase [Streptomyces ovatisporus]|uniref:6-phosphogluconolactonase n=1 Tax=Streptomyces ovatisporus TaxID=1128682 RepID=A0ABV9AEB8_9ACTN
MSTPLEIVVHGDKEEMARSTAAALAGRIAEAQRARGTASVVLTGGRNGNALLAALAAPGVRDSVDFSRLELWWGDERFLPEGDPERNVTQAREAFLAAVPADPARVHAMPSSDGAHGDDVEAAAEAYAAELAAAARPEDQDVPVPSFDVLLLGVGPDTHVASLFPGHAGAQEAERTVVGVRGAPKPPPVRISLTLPAIRAAREVWLLAAGEDKAEAVARVLGGDAAPHETDAPAAGAYGRERTRWLLDEAAASLLPRDGHSPRT